MPMAAVRETVDLSGYPELVVVILGMRVNRLTGLKTLLGFGPRIAESVEAQPEGLLLHENLVFSLFPLHIGMRQYWANFEALETWARSDPHRQWWQRFLKDSGGTGFWHELYRMQGGMEAVYVDVPVRVGFLAFAPAQPAHGPRFTARTRLGLPPVPGTQPVPVPEDDLHG